MAGSRLVAVQVSLENAKSADALEVTFDNLKLVSDKNQVFEPYSSGHDDELKVAKLNKGEKANGWVAYEVPKDAKLSKVRYTVGLLATVQLEAPLPTK